MQYSVTFSCGHTDGVDLFGPGDERQRKIKWFEEYGLCPECFKAQREAEKKAREEQRQEENEAAAANAKALGLPELTGTERQVAWANTIRQKFVEDAQASLNKRIETHGESEETDDFRGTYLYIVDNVINASEWIDNRLDFSRFMLKYKDRTTERTPEDVHAETTVEPENKKHSGIVEIAVKADEIEAMYQLNEEFRQIVKSLGYKWDSAGRYWSQKIGVRSGDIADRAAELGNKLLLAGFAVQIQDEDIRNNAINGTYEPECKRWVMVYTSGDYEGWLSIGWEKGNEDIYTKARAIRGSRWHNSRVAVPITECDQVLDFADTMGFKISNSAQKAIEAYRESVKIVTPQAPPEPEQIDKLGEILKSDTDVLDDLRDD